MSGAIIVWAVADDAEPDDQLCRALFREREDAIFFAASLQTQRPKVAVYRWQITAETFLPDPEG